MHEDAPASRPSLRLLCGSPAALQCLGVPMQASGAQRLLRNPLKRYSRPGLRVSIGGGQSTTQR